jgi:hypothetical protein
MGISFFGTPDMGARHSRPDEAYVAGLLSLRKTASSAPQAPSFGRLRFSAAASLILRNEPDGKGF